MGKIVRCIDASTSGNALTEGDEYEVVVEKFDLSNNKIYEVRNLKTNKVLIGWFASRFADVSANVPPGTTKYVRCIDNHSRECELFIGAVYEVIHVNGNIYTLSGVSKSANANRFAPVNPSSELVRCVDSSGPTCLQANSIYERTGYTANSTGDTEYVLAGFKYPFEKKRFESLSCGTPEKLAESVGGKTLIVDKEEERIWTMWKAPQTGHCPCGILKAHCSYHK